MTRTAINLYSVRDLEEPTTAILDRVADAGYDGVQFSGAIEEGVDEIRRTLEDRGLQTVPAHVGIDSLENRLKRTLDQYGTLGCDGLVVPWLPPSAFETETAVRTTIDRLDEIGDRVQSAGFSFHYHNHDQEFQPVGPATGFDLLTEHTCFGIELDVGWAAAGGRDPATLLETLGDRGRLVHLKDVEIATATPVEIGTGDVDMRACADAARDAGAEWLIYEHDEPDDPIESIGHGAQFLASL